MAFQLPELGYAYDALEPNIDARTMEIHHSKHHNGYTTKLNGAIAGSDLEGKSIEDILDNLDMSNAGVRNNGGGFYNHFLYFQNLSPEKKTPKGDLLNSIKKSFGGISDLKKKMEEAGTGLFGSGWVWLVANKDGDLSLQTTANQDNPIMKKSFKGEIHLGMDVWEHAYYLKHKADRKAYIKDFLDVVDWDVVEDRFNKFVK